MRGEKDYSVIIIIGTELVRLIRSRETKEVFSGQTRMQIDIGQEIVGMAQNSPGRDHWDTLNGVINQCLKRDPGWKKYYAEQMDDAIITVSSDVTLDMFAMELNAEESAQVGDINSAISIIQKLIDTYVTDPNDRGWYLQELARYSYQSSKSESNNYQVNAHRKNRMVMRPANGMIVDRIKMVSQKRIENIKDWVSAKGSYDELRLAVGDIIGSLEFGTKADRFECAIQELGTALGFLSQRPDKEWKAGPDNLWAVRDGEYFVIECKSEVDASRAEINKGETGQMNNACAWFQNNYPGTISDNILIIPTKKLSDASGFNLPVSILRRGGLRKLVGSVNTFFQEFSALDLSDLSVAKIQSLLDSHKLTLEGIKSHFEVPVQR